MLWSVLIWSLLVAAPCAKKFGGSSTGRSQGGAHYPRSTGLSGNTNTYNAGHTYPHSTGMSGNYVGHRSSNPNPRPQVHHHYNYNPPTHISYGATQHPVYHGPPPVYVYEYRNSGSRYDSLLTGLALYNLGRMSAGNDHHHYNNYNSGGSSYRTPPGDICKLRIERNSLEYEETRIDCMLISSFIMEAPRESKNVVVHTVTSTVNVTQKGTTENGTNSNITVTTVQNTTVVDALSVKGPSVQVTPEMQCFVTRWSTYGANLKKKVECGLLQEYARRSMVYKSSNRLVSDVAIFGVIIYLINLCRYLLSS